MSNAIDDSERAAGLAKCVRQHLAGALLISEKRMFGGITFMLNGNMLCCASRSGLMVRVGAVGESAALSRPAAKPCMGTGRRMTGFVMVGHEGLATQRDVVPWLQMALTYVRTLPVKPAAKPIRKRRK